MAGDMDKVLAAINKRYEGTVIVKAKGTKSLGRILRVQTGNLAYDTSIGLGIPVGRMIQLKGEYSSGKSALALRIAAAFQRVCRKCTRPMFKWDELLMKKTNIRCCADPTPSVVVWADVEDCFDNKWAEKMGVDTDGVYVIRSEYAEQCIDIADEMIRSGGCDLLVIDSVAAMTPSIEITESAEKWQMGVHARLMNKAMRKWGSAMSADSLTTAFPCTVVLINQVRVNIGGYGSPKTTPGGKGVGYHSSIITEVKRKDYLTSPEGMPLGVQIEAATGKNKTAPPNRACMFDIVFKSISAARKVGSTNLAHQVVALASYWGVIKQEGSWYEVAQGFKFQGLDATAAALEASDKRGILHMLVKEIIKRELGFWGDSLDDNGLEALASMYVPKPAEIKAAPKE